MVRDGVSILLDSRALRLPLTLSTLGHRVIARSAEVVFESGLFAISVLSWGEELEEPHSEKRDSNDSGQSLSL